ncbi:hypothetical protein F4679DRAFT_530152 [Xylaria curta]|nr:hypothetical protein F4679DRAFT_530152 [Xylaria curta]
MPIKKNHRPVFERLRREYNIVFADTLASNDWPANHRIVFESIDKLKQFKYSTYATPQDCRDDLDTTPWKGEAKIRARKLTDKVKDCLSRNEATWRFACEPLVFSRLNSEVACKTCRQRVWRSEVEAKLDGDNNAASNLRQRQENRDRCRCPRSSRPDDENERVGLNKLFIDRADDTVIHPLRLARKLPQEQKPDRIYGLRQTRNFEDLLLADLGDGRFLEDRLHKQPHSATEGEAMLFPFLVVEAKAGNASDDWSSIRLQTAFPIYTYLNAQQSIKKATARKSRWATGPLVWFFMSRGEDWRLSLAYQEQSAASRLSSHSRTSTKIIQVWAGCITNRDDALQLFLIVDYLSDWARDIYRPAILIELRILASVNTDVRTVFTDTDIYSSRNILPTLKAEKSIEEQLSNGDVQAGFRKFDCDIRAVRHISPIQSRFLSIFITADNVQTFILSLKKNFRKFLVRRMIKKLSSTTRKPNLFTVNELYAIEKLWTGQSRLSGPYHFREIRFYTVHLVTYYMSASWEQIRDLCVISVAEDAFDILVTESKSKAKRGKARKPAVKVNEDSNASLLTGLARLHAASAQRNLLATASRVSRYVDGTIDPSRGECWFKRGDAVIWEIVNNIYEYQKKGDLEPELPYLHISTSYEMQVVKTKDQDGSKSSLFDISSENPEYEITVPPLSGYLKISGIGGILIWDRAKLCIYVVRRSTQPPNISELSRILKKGDEYHTTRDDGTLNLQISLKDHKIWNIEEPNDLSLHTIAKYCRHERRRF